MRSIAEPRSATRWKTQTEDTSDMHLQTSHARTHRRAHPQSKQTAWGGGTLSFTSHLIQAGVSLSFKKKKQNPDWFLSGAEFKLFNLLKKKPPPEIHWCLREDSPTPNQMCCSNKGSKTCELSRLSNDINRIKLLPHHDANLEKTPSTEW